MTHFRRRFSCSFGSTTRFAGSTRWGAGSSAWRRAWLAALGRKRLGDARPNFRAGCESRRLPIAGAIPLTSRISGRCCRPRLSDCRIVCGPW